MASSPFPQDAHQLVSLLHNSSHYAVLTIDIPGKIFKIYDGLSCVLLQWMDHIVLALKKCMLLDVLWLIQYNDHSRCWITTGCITQQETSKKPSMAIQLPFLCVHHGGLRGVTSTTRRMDLTVVPPPASNLWTYMMWSLSHSLRYSTTEITFAESSCVNGSICSSIMTKTPCCCLKWQSGQNASQLKTMSLLLKMDSTLHPCVAICCHEKKMAPLNNVGWYILFDSKCFHQGFYNNESGKIFVQAQLFCRHSVGGATTPNTAFNSISYFVIDKPEIEMINTY